MPFITVTLGQPEPGWLTTWGPLLGSVLVAGIALFGVLRAANKGADSALKVSERAAQSLLDAEDARARAEDRRHLRALVADVSSAATQRGALVLQFVTAYGANAGHLWTEAQQGASEEASRALLRANALVGLTTKDEMIRGALNGIVRAENGLKAAVNSSPPGTSGHMSPAHLEAIEAATRGLDHAGQTLVHTAAEQLAGD